jgi:hypothetical protein
MVLETSFQLKNVHLITYNKSDDVEAKFKCSEKITAVQHGDGISFGSSLILLIPFLFKISTKGSIKPCQEQPLLIFLLAAIC